MSVDCIVLVWYRFAVALDTARADGALTASIGTARHNAATHIRLSSQTAAFGFNILYIRSVLLAQRVCCAVHVGRDRGLTRAMGPSLRQAARLLLI